MSFSNTNYSSVQKAKPHSVQNLSFGSILISRKQIDTYVFNNSEAFINQTLFIATNCVFLPVVLEVLVVQENLEHFLLPQHLHLETHVDLVVPEDQECQADHLHHVHPSAQVHQTLPRVMKKTYYVQPKHYIHIGIVHTHKYSNCNIQSVMTNLTVNNSKPIE